MNWYWLLFVFINIFLVGGILGIILCVMKFLHCDNNSLFSLLLKISFKEYNEVNYEMFFISLFFAISGAVFYTDCYYLL